MPQQDTTSSFAVVWPIDSGDVTVTVAASSVDRAIAVARQRVIECVHQSDPSVISVNA